MLNKFQLLARKTLAFVLLVLPPGLNIFPSPAFAETKWQVKSVDTQIVSKCWLNVPPQNIADQVALIKSLGVNYVAIGTPYDRPDEMAKWTGAIHAAGLNVWFRSHWLNWEGDEGRPKNMTPQNYLNQTQSFILAHPGMFKPGDAFTMSVEAENVGIGSGKPFPDWNSYRNFLNNEIDISNGAFARIGLQDQIHTNWLSMNGWIVENELDQNIVKKMGLLTIDHYPSQEANKPKVSAAKMATIMSSDLDRFYAKWNMPILIGEWGYYIQGEVPDSTQARYLRSIYTVFKNKPYIYGVNYWDHMGNQTSLMRDKSGTNLHLRPSALVLKEFLTAK